MLGQEERRRDFAIRVALGDQVGNPPLTFGELATRRRAAADASELGAGLLRPERRADALELDQRLLERRARGAASLRTTMRSSESKQCARALEGIDVSRMLGERAVEARERAVSVSTRREQQATASRQDRQRPRPVDSLG